MSTIEPDDAIQYPGHPAGRLLMATFTAGLLLAAAVAIYLEPWFILEQVREAVSLNDIERQRALVDPPLIGTALAPYLEASKPGSGRRVEKRYAGFSRFLVIAQPTPSPADSGSRAREVTLVLERRGLSWHLANVIGPEPWAAGDLPGVPPGPPAAPAPGADDSLPAFGSYVYVEELPRPVTHVAPGYPPLARESGVQGTVLVQALVGRDGLVKDARVVRSIPMLDAAALAAVRQWRFAPARAQGRPVAVWVAVPVKFTLH